MIASALKSLPDGLTRGSNGKESHVDQVNSQRRNSASAFRVRSFRLRREGDQRGDQQRGQPSTAPQGQPQRGSQAPKPQPTQRQDPTTQRPGRAADSQAGVHRATQPAGLRWRLSRRRQAHGAHQWRRPPQRRPAAAVSQVRTGFLQSRATSWTTQHHTWQQRGGYNGYRVPESLPALLRQAATSSASAACPCSSSAAIRAFSTTATGSR